MKNILTIFTIISLAACGGSPSGELEKKQGELVQKEKELASIKKEILDLKRDIAALDTSIQDNAIAVMALEIKEKAFKNPFEVQGLVESDKNVLVSPEVPAKILKLYVKEGQQIKKGEIIASLDGSIAKAQISELEGSLELAQANFEKQQRLWKQNIGSEMQFLQAKNQYESLKNKIKTANTQLGKYALKAPISGTVDEIMANEGELVGSLTGGPVVRIVNLSDIKIVASVSETYLDKIQVGQNVEIHFPSLQINSKEKISAVSNIINSNNRTFSFYIKPTQHIELMKPNLLAMITAYDYVDDEAISVPTKLVRIANEEYFIYTIKKEGDRNTVQKSIIEIKQQFPNETIIKSGLKPGDLIITEGVNSVIVGDQVKIISE